MKIPDRPLSVILCNNNRNFEIICLSLGKGRVVEVHTNIVITYQLVLQINGKEYVSRLKMTICKYILRKVMRSSTLDAVDDSFSSSLYYSLPLLSQLMLLLPFLLEVNRYYPFNCWQRRGRNSTKRGERSVHCCFSQPCCEKKYTCILSFLVGTYISFHWFVVLVGRWLQYWYKLLWPFLFPKIEK